MAKPTETEMANCLRLTADALDAACVLLDWSWGRASGKTIDTGWRRERTMPAYLAEAQAMLRRLDGGE